MPKFRKKPVVIEASQWFKNGDHPDDYTRDHDGLENGELRVFTAAERNANGWEGDVVRYFRHPYVPGDKPCEHCGNTMHVHGWIDTLEGGHIVCPGDWIITGVKGERYPCKPDIFADTYEAAEDCQCTDEARCIRAGLCQEDARLQLECARSGQMSGRQITEEFTHGCKKCGTLYVQEQPCDWCAGEVAVGVKAVEDPSKPTSEQMMAGYAVACRFGVLEARAFQLAEQMWQAMSNAGVIASDGSQQG